MNTSQMTQSMVGSKILVAVVAALTAATGMAVVVSPTKPGFKDISGVTVGSGETATVSDDVIVGEGAEFRKTGSGSLTVPLSRVNRQIGWGMTVSEGKLRLEAGADGTAATPPAAMQKAALWLSAESGVVTTNANDIAYAKKWVDVRDAENPDAPLRPYLTPAWTSGGASASKGAPPVKTESDGFPAVYFGGKGTGKYMTYSAAVTDVYHAFVVQNIQTCFGPVLGGSWSYGLLPNWISPGTVNVGNAGYLGPRLDMQWAAGTARHSLNGRKVDPYSVKVSAGFQLMGIDYIHCRDTIRFMFRGGYDANWAYGGDYVSEVVLFTNRLATGEALDVERYLLRKYSLPAKVAKDYTPVPTPGQVAIASNAVVEVFAGSGESTASAVFVGDGKVSKIGSGTMEVGPTDGKRSMATLDLAAGTVHLRGGQMPPVEVNSGDRYTANVFFPSRYQSEEVKAGGKVTRASDAPAGTATMDGKDWVRVNAVKDGVQALNVKSGVLQLVAKAHGDDIPSGAFGATVANCDFEQPFSVTANPGLGEIGTATVNGWYLPNSAYVKPCYVAFTNSSAKTWFGSCGKPPSGNQVLLFRMNCQAETIVAVPQAGDYDLEFYAASRYSNQQIELLNVSFGAVGGTMRQVAGEIVPSGLSFQRFRYRLDALDAGEYRLRFTANPNIGDASALLDDVRIVCVGKRRERAVFKVPNGDFERFDRNSRQPFHYLGYGSVNNPGVHGWDFDNGGATMNNSLTNDYIGVVGPGMLASSTSKWMIYEPTAANWGNLALVFMKNYWTASTTFAAPKGKFKLSAQVAWRAAELGSNNNGGGSLSATVVLADGTELPLGSVSLSVMSLSNRTWPTVFEILEEQNVTLKLKQTAGTGSALVDDLVFVDADEPADGNYLSNGGAESDLPGTWTGSRIKYDTTPGGVSVYGYQSFEGDYAFAVNGTGKLIQNVTFQTPGLYRFTMHGRSRPNNSTFGTNRMKIWYVKSGTVATNVIDDLTVAYSSGFLERSYFFNVDSAGTYSFGLTAHGASSDRTSFLDGLSIRKVEETLESTPSVPDGMSLKIGSGARAVLDYTGTITVKKLVLGGVRVPAGTVTAADYPEFLGGIGSIEVLPPTGSTIIVY